MILDPTTSSSPDELPETWGQESRRVLSKFYSGTDLSSAMGQLYQLVQHSGAFGVEVQFCREAADKVADYCWEAPHPGRRGATSSFDQ